MNIPKKRLFVCCDGTGNNAVQQKHEETTNVARFARCVKPVGTDEALQVVYYREGIGIVDSKLDFLDAALGLSTIRNLSYPS
jgi:uncharacterized protein (DUF2235 family)